MSVAIKGHVVGRRGGGFKPFFFFFACNLSSFFFASSLYATALYAIGAMRLTAHVVAVRVHARSGANEALKDSSN